MDRLSVLRAATTGGRALNGLGEHTRPVPGAAADLILVDGDPLTDPMALRNPVGVITFGRLIVDPTVGEPTNLDVVEPTKRAPSVEPTNLAPSVGPTEPAPTVELTKWDRRWNRRNQHHRPVG